MPRDGTIEHVVSRVSPKLPTSARPKKSTNQDTNQNYRPIFPDLAPILLLAKLGSEQKNVSEQITGAIKKPL